MPEKLTIIDAASKIGVSIDTIRRWEKKGLIKSIRSDQNHRLFSLDEILRVHNKVSGDSNGVSHYKILRAKKKSPYTCIDLFAGAGGTALGIENAGIKHIMLNEKDKHATQTLRDNRPNWKVIEDDIANVDFTPYAGKVDIVEGGFPCQTFSYAGKKAGFEDARGTMFYQFARAVKEVRPKIAIGENVRGLLTHDNGRTLNIMIGILQDLGYKVAYRVHKAQYYDVPQKRERLLIFAIRNDIENDIVFPAEKDYTVSIREALENCPPSEGQLYSEKKKEMMDLVPEGGYWKDLPVDIQKEYMKASYFMGGGKTGMARRLSWSEPSLTLVCTPAQKQTERCHPGETRPLNVREYARIQTFPDEWKFSGSVSAQYKQIGNAVPVNLGYYMGLSALAMITGEYDEKSFIVAEPLARVESLQVEESDEEAPRQLVLAVA
jgi:DNA (cytosine-5)-methyltransferase 1